MSAARHIPACFLGTKHDLLQRSRFIDCILSQQAVVQVALPAGAADLLSNARHRASLCSTLLQCFAFDRAAAPLLLFSGAADGGGSYGGALAPALPADVSRQDVAKDADMPSASSTGGAARAMHGTADVPATATSREPDSVSRARMGSNAAGRLMAVLLPRMPAGLLYVASPRAYEALARVPRTLGRLAAADDVATPGAALCLAT